MVIADVQRVAQSVTNEVEAGYRDSDCNSGNDCQPRCAAQILLGAIEHVAPAGQWRLDPVTEEADVGFHENGARDRQGGSNDNWTDGVGQYLAEHDVGAAQS